MATEEDEEIWKLAEFLAQEAYAMRSLLMFLASSPDSERLKNWRQEVANVLGAPTLEDTAEALGTIRAMRPQWRKLALQQLLEQLQAHYLPK